MRKPFTVVHEALAGDVAEVLKELYSQKDGIIGIAFVVMYRGRRFAVGCAGEATRNPTWTRGMVAKLDDRLAEASDQV